MAAPEEQDLEAASSDSDAVERCPTESARSCDMEPGRGGPVTAPMRLLWRNPQLAKVILTVGLQMAAADIAGTIDLGPDTIQTWREKTSVYSAAFAIAGDVVSYATGPIFGRFADTVDRRIVLVVYGFITFLPTFVYWFFYPYKTPSVVVASHVASIFAAVGRSSNAAYALSADVTAFEDRALASGLFYGLTNLGVLLLSVFPALVIEFFDPLGVQGWYNDHPRSVLYYQAALVTAFVVSAISIAEPRKRGAEDNCFESSNNNNNNSSNSNGCNNSDMAEGSRCCKCPRDWVVMVKLLRTDERIRRLSICALCLSTAGTIAVGNDGQYFATSLGLFRSSNNTLEYKTLEFDRMNILRSLGAEIMVMPAFLLAGYFAMKSGTLKVLRRFVPVTAVLVASGAFLKMIGHLWFVPVVVAVQTMGDLYRVPLMRLAFGVAKPGRTGTWLSLVGMAVEAGSILGNLVIIALNFALRDGGAWLWAYYPAAGLVALLGLLPLLGTPKLSIGWGAAAGSCKEQFAAMMAAKKLGRRWRNKSNKTIKTLGMQSDPPPPACQAGGGGSSPELQQAESQESSEDNQLEEEDNKLEDDQIDACTTNLTSGTPTLPGDIQGDSSRVRL